MNRNKKITLCIVLIILALFLGAFRQILFVNINNQITFLSAELDQNYLLSYLKSLEKFTYNQLVILKWVFTIIFTICFWLIGRFFLRRIMNSPTAAQWYGLAYVFFFAISGLCFLLGSTIGFKENFYSLSRSLMGALQSPIPLLFITPLLLLKNRV